MISEVRVETEMTVKFTVVDRGKLKDTLTDDELKEQVTKGVVDLLESAYLENIEVELVNCEIEWIPKGVTFNE